MPRRPPAHNPLPSGPAAVGRSPNPNTTLPDTARQETLLREAASNRDAGRPPYAGVRIESRGELDWILASTEGWDGENDAYFVKYVLIPRGERHTPADLRGANLSEIALGDVSLRMADLRGANLVYAGLRGAHLRDVQLSGADLGFCDLERAELDYADLSGAHMRGANLSCAVVKYAVLDGARLHQADLRGADLHGVRMDRGTVLSAVLVDSSTRLADVIWSDAGLTRVDWSQVRRLGDEARISAAGDRTKRLAREETAIRAYRQLALALQAQGMGDAAARFALRSQVLRRRFLRHRGHIGRWLFSWLLALLAGYGYRLGRILIAYLSVVLICAGAYFALGWLGYGPALAPQEALLASVTAFHGRVFSEHFSLQTPQAWVAAGEAIAGLVIEGVFIAMLVQRVFAGK